MNSIVISGYVSRDLTVHKGSDPKSKTVVNYTVAVKRRFKREGEPDADFFNCASFGKQAEFCEKYIKKGSKVLIRGSMRQKSYEDKNGNRVYSWELIADEVDLADGKRGESGGAETTSEPAGETAQEGYMDVPDDTTEFPFA